MSRRPVGSVRWLRDGVARVELEHGYDPLTGLRRRMSQTVHGTQADAERVLAGMLLEIGQLPSGKQMTVCHYIDQLYKPWLQGHVRQETRHGYEAKLDNHVLPKLGDMQLTKLEPYVLDRWRDDLLTRMSGQSALHVYRALNTALNRAVKWRLLTANPLRAVDPPKARTRPLDTLTGKDVIAYLKAFDSHRLAPICIVAMATGLRPCELYALTWQDIDLSDASVRVRRGLHEHKSQTWFEPPKSERSNRIVSLPAWAVDALKPLRGIGPLVAGDGVEGHARPTAIARQYRRHVQASDLRYVPMRDLRHTHATLLLEADVNIVVVSRRLGHSTVAITDKHYLRPKRAADQQAADAFGNLLAGIGGKDSLAGSSGTTKG